MSAAFGTRFPRPLSHHTSMTTAKMICWDRPKRAPVLSQCHYRHSAYQANGEVVVLVIIHPFAGCCIAVSARSRCFLSSQTHSYFISNLCLFKKVVLQYWISLWALKSLCHTTIRHSVVHLPPIGAPHSQHLEPRHPRV